MGVAWGCLLRVRSNIARDFLVNQWMAKDDPFEPKLLKHMVAQNSLEQVLHEQAINPPWLQPILCCLTMGSVPLESRMFLSNSRTGILTLTPTYCLCGALVNGARSGEKSN